MAAVFEPEYLSRHVRRHVLAVRNPRHLAVLVAEDLDRGIALADGALVERSLDAVADGGEALEIGCGVKRWRCPAAR